jgi:hypothetical protein
VNPKWRAWGLKYGRVWILADKSHGKNPRWVGYLEYVNRDFSALTRFRPQYLLRADVSLAVAKNGRGQYIYGYDRRSPKTCYNCIYDDKPLEGWWPWPKEGGHTAVDPFLGAKTWEDELFRSFASVPDGSDPGAWAKNHRGPTSYSAGRAEGATSGNAGCHQATESCVVM